MSTSVLSRVDRLTHKLGPISVAIDAMIEHLVPQKTTSASCGGIVCYSYCETTGDIGSCGSICLGILKHVYSASAHYCAHGIYSGCYTITCAATCQEPGIIC